MPSILSLSDPFIAAEKDDTAPCLECGRRLPKIGQSRKSLTVTILGLITVFNAICMALLFKSNRTHFSAGTNHDSNHHDRPSLYTPFTSGLRYEIETTPPDYWNSDLYMGPPCNDSERAWNRLIHPGRAHGIRLYREEAARLDINESIHLPDDNFAVILTVHHNLHCLRRMRQSLFPEHYYPDWTAEDFAHDREHNLHCMESLRTSMICQPDLAPLPYYWSRNIWHEMNASPQVKRECVNWDAFSEYLKTRSYHVEDLVRDY